MNLSHALIQSKNLKQSDAQLTLKKTQEKLRLSETTQEQLRRETQTQKNLRKNSDGKIKL